MLTACIAKTAFSPLQSSCEEVQRLSGIKLFAALARALYVPSRVEKGRCLHRGSGPLDSFETRQKYPGVLAYCNHCLQYEIAQRITCKTLTICEGLTHQSHRITDRTQKEGKGESLESLPFRETS